MSVFFGRSLLAVLVLLIVAAVLAVGNAFLKTHREYTHLQERQRELELNVAQLRVQHDQREAYLRLMLNDPSFLERVARERLGLARQEETIFRFDGRR
ncbi:MAG: septum formation initiator family protein [Verrucomicrobia bacterium]|nr:septum formation initiator family protein [Verrucomicrobiota bacterium]